jgi:hypothetical protein
MSFKSEKFCQRWLESRLKTCQKDGDVELEMVLRWGFKGAVIAFCNASSIFEKRNESI